MSYYKIDVSLENGDIYERILESKKDISFEDIQEGVLKDVFFKIEDGDLESVGNIDFKEISEEVFETVKDTESVIELILANDGYIKRPLVGLD